MQHSGVIKFHGTGNQAKIEVTIPEALLLLLLLLIILLVITRPKNSPRVRRESRVCSIAKPTCRELLKGPFEQTWSCKVTYIWTMANT